MLHAASNQLFLLPPRAGVESQWMSADLLLSTFTCCYGKHMVLGWFHVLFSGHLTTSLLIPTTPNQEKFSKNEEKLSKNPLRKPILSKISTSSHAPESVSISPKSMCFDVSCFRISHAPWKNPVKSNSTLVLGKT